MSKAQQSLSIHQLQSKGNLHLLEGNTDAAKQEYLKILNSGKTSASLEHNLGIIYTKNNQWGQGLEHLNKAAWMQRFNADFKNSLSKTEKHVRSQRINKTLPVQYYVYKAKKFFRPEEASITACLIIFALLSTKLFNPAFFTRFKKAFLCTSFALFAWALGTHYFGDLGVIRYTSKIRKSPRDSSLSFREISSGQYVEIEKRSKKYIKISLPNKFTGWIESENVGQFLDVKN